MLSDHLSIRIDPKLRESLQRRAKQARLDVTALARRYVEEGLIQDKYPGIYFRDTGYGRTACLRGTRIYVGQLVQIIEGFEDLDYVAATWRLDRDDLATVMEFYTDFREEIDAWNDFHHAENERIRKEWLVEHPQDALDNAPNSVAS
jgi:uncharacterized protein (DUF433 family)